MSELSVFNFDSQSVRTVTDDVTGEPLFVGKDVCAVLGYRNHNDAMNDHCKGVAKRHPLQTAGGRQELRVLTEADVLPKGVRTMHTLGGPQEVAWTMMKADTHNFRTRSEPRKS